MTDGSKELVGYNNQLEDTYNKILNIEKSIPELKEFRESLAQSDSKQNFWVETLNIMKMELNGRQILILNLKIVQIIAKLKILFKERLIKSLGIQ